MTLAPGSCPAAPSSTSRKRAFAEIRLLPGVGREEDAVIPGFLVASESREVFSEFRDVIRGTGGMSKGGPLLEPGAL